VTAGIGIAIALVAIIAVLVAFFCFKKWRKLSAHKAQKHIEIGYALEAQSGGEPKVSANTNKIDSKDAPAFQIAEREQDTPEDEDKELETSHMPIRTWDPIGSNPAI
jgi:hypothetical protein